MDRVKVVVADGQRLFADALAVALRTFPNLEVAEALPVSGQDALRAATKLSPDVVVLDYWISGMPGPAATAAILRTRPKTKVIMLGWFLGPRDAQIAREAGAVALLGKDIDLDRLVDPIREAALMQPGHPSVASTGAPTRDDIDAIWRRVGTLKPREVEVLEILGNGQTLDAAAARLQIAPRTARNLVHGAMTKIGARTQAEAVKLTVGPDGITPLKRDPDAPSMPSVPPKQPTGDAAGYPRTLVADGQPLFAEALARALREWWVPVIDEHPTSVDETLDAIGRHRPDVVLVDYWLEGRPTLERLLVSEPRSIVIALSGLFEADHVRQALRAGAAGFLPKNVTVPVVAAAIRRGAAGELLVFGQSVAAWLDWLGGAPLRATAARARFDAVTRREFEVLRLLDEGHPIARVAEQLSLRPSTIKNHVRSLLRKTGTESQAEVLALARRAFLIGT